MKQVIPYKGLSFLTNYLQLVRLNRYIPNYRAKLLLKFKSIFIVLFLEAVHFTRLYLLAPSKGRVVTQYDLVQIANLPHEANLCITGVIWLAGYFIYILYFCDHSLVNSILYDVVVLRSANFFIYSHNRDRSVSEHVRLFSYAMTNLFQVFIVVIGKLSMI